jgi:hypothetical protein
VGRFYETFGNSIGNTLDRTISEPYIGTQKKWSMPSPPYTEVRWSMRNNLNYQQTADLLAFYFVATNKDFFLQNFWRRGYKAYALGKSEPPYAYIIPSGQKDPIDMAYLVNVLLKQRIEVHQATAPIRVEEGVFPEGSYVVRMDQPYRNLVLNLLDLQKYPKDASPSYDDTGWTLGLHMGVETVKIEDKAVFDASVAPVTEPVKVTGAVLGGKAAGAYIINHGTANRLLTARVKLADFRALAAEASFKAEGREFAAGSMIFPVSGASPGIHEAIESVAADLGLDVLSSSSVPEVKAHELDIARIAIFHTWHSTQDDGWVRYAFDQLKIPFAMIHKDHLRQGALKAKYDVIILSNCRGRTGADIVNGLDPAKHGPLAFVRTEQFIHLGTPDSSQDITGGMGIEGVRTLQQFVEEGGLLIALHNAVRVPVDYGMVRGVTIADTGSDFYNPGSLFKGEVFNEKHPIAYGYGRNPVIFRSQRGPLLSLGEVSSRSSELDKQKHIVVRFADEEGICLSGIIKDEKTLNGKAAIIDLPLGKGHVLLFTFNPFWRDLSHSSYMFVFNAILNYNDFDVGTEEPPTTEITQNRIRRTRSQNERRPDH